MFAVLDTNHFREYAHASAAGSRLMARIEQEKPDIFAYIVAEEESLSRDHSVKASA
ncbi:MAG: hypothetical protein JNM65_06320 [Verrucomicrobiaceae bacterium]|nr:hypothetical protein [Verrucomicrobiaceae bacterium]